MPPSSVFTDVLPLLPVNPTTTAGRPCCMPAANSPSASCVSAHSTCGSGLSTRPGNQQRHGAVGLRLRDEGVRVEVLAAQCHEQRLVAARWRGCR
jgi:hypothetical protein